MELHKVISDITEVTGLRIIQAILDGERDRQKLAALKDRRIRSSQDRIAKALEGDYRSEHLFVLGQALATYRSSKHFTSWLGICPDNRITGGKVKSSRTRPVKNRAADAFRIAAQAVANSSGPIGAF